MRVATGTVFAGKVLLEGADLSDGTRVFVLTRDVDSPLPISAEELAEVEAGIAEADRGELVSGEEFLRSLRRYG